MTRRVLIIDDEPTVRNAIARALRHFGYDVVSVSGGDSAYEILQHDRFDALLIDIRMPLMSGDALFVCIVRRWPDLRDRIILMSGDPDNAMAAWSAELKRRPLLSKPFTLAALQRAIESVMVTTQARPRIGNGL
jgi:DNA-binding NtrC family response regulator